ncbi:hypothetical protein [Microbacterium sp. 179-I 3D4 NHS]|uniref:hypothetical protein n=1 Tax=Microbacterium sp. 179-I 3D4 NHS TaxID=3142381 RepID=UPI0039A2068D
MTDVLIDDVGMGFGKYLKTRPDLFRPERSPIRTGIWIVVILIGIGIGILAIVNPEAFIRGGRESVGVRGGLGMIVAPILITALGVIGLIWWSRRWRTPGGGKMSTAVSSPFSHVDPAEAWAALERTTSADDPALIDLLTRIHREPPTGGAWSFDVVHSPQDRIMVGMVTRLVPKKPNDPQSGVRNQLEREPVVRVGDAYIDLKAASVAATKRV